MAGQRRLTLEVLGDASGAVRALKATEAATSSFGSKLQSAGKSMMSFGSKMTLGVTAPLVAFAATSVKAFSEAQGAQTKLADAFARFPKLADSNVAAINAIGQSIMKKSRFDDDSVASGAAVLAQYKLTGKQIEAALPLLADYAAKTGRDIPTAAAVFGKAMLGKGRALADVGIQFKDTKDLAGNYAQVMDGLSRKVGGFAAVDAQTLTGSLEAQKVKFGELQEKIGGALMPALEKLMGVVGKVADWFDNLSPKAQNLILIGGGIAAAIGPVVTILGALAAAIGFLLSPIGLAVVAVAALAAGAVYAYTHFKGFRDVVDGVVQWLRTNVPAAFEAVKATIVRVINDIKAAWDRWGDDIIAAARRAWELVKSVIQVPLEAIKGAIKVVLDVIKGDWGKAWDDLKATAGRVWNAIVAMVRSWGPALLAAAKAVFDGLWKGLDAARSLVVQKIGELKTTIFGLFMGAAGWLLEAGRQVVSGLISGIGSMFGALGSKLKDLALLIPRTVKGWLDSHSPSRVMEQIGSDTGQGLTIGIQNEIANVRAAAGKMGEETVWAVGKATSGPKGAAAGKAVADNVAKGIKSGSANAIAAAKKLADKIAETIDNAVQGVSARISAAGGLRSARTGLTGAQSNVNAVKARMATIDDRIAAAQARLNSVRSEGVDITAEEQVAIDDASAALADAIEKYNAGEISAAQLAVAQHRLTAAQNDAVASTGDVASAMQDLIDLQNEKVGLNGELADAENALAEAQMAVAQAQLDNYKATTEFNKQGPNAVALFEQYATKAGLAASQIRMMVDAMNAVPTGPSGSKSSSWNVGAFNTGGGITSPNIITAVDLVAQKYALDQAAAMELWATALSSDGVWGNQQLAMDLLGVHFAKGGVVSGPTFGLMGEYPSASSNPEIIAPQSIMRDTVLSALAESGAGGSVVVNVQGSVITERDLVDRIRRALLEEQQRGRTLVVS